MKNLKKKDKQASLNRVDSEPNQQKEQQKDDESPYYDNPSAIDLNRFLSKKNVQNPLELAPQEGYANVPPASANIEPSMLEYKLQQLLHESKKREESYQQYIKKKHEQSYQMTQNYLKSLQKYKEELDKYVEEKNKKRQSKFVKYASNKIINGQMTNFSNFNKKKLEVYYPPVYLGKENTAVISHKINLKCIIGLKCLTPLVQDYLREKFPFNIDVQIKLPIKAKYLWSSQKSTQTLQAKVRIDEDESENIENLIYGYPFSLFPSGDRNDRQLPAKQGETMKYEFTILNEEQNLETIERNKVWINIYNRDSQMLWAYSNLHILCKGSFPADQLLYYHKDSTLSRPIATEQTEIVELYSPYSHKKNGLLQIRLQVQPCYMQENSNKVESNQPMELAKIYIDRNLYGDKQSRLIQRINKFKTATTSLIMRPDAHYFNKESDKEEYFKTTNDKTLIEHRKRKELQSINKFKEEHKPELMEKLFDQALQKYSLQDIELGSPKYLLFYFEKTQPSHQRIHSQISIKLNGHPKHQQQILRQTQVQLMNKKIAESLVNRGIIKLKQHATTDIEILAKQGNRATIDIYDNRVVLVVKVLIYPTVQMEEVLAQVSDKLRCDVSLKIDSQDNELLSEQVFKLKPVPISTEYQVSLHNYEHQTQLLSLPLNISSTQKNPELQSALNSIQVIASSDVQFRISNPKDILDLKVKFPKLKIPQKDKPVNNMREIQVTLLDGGLNFVLYSFRVKLFTYHKMKQIPQYFIGSICRYKFKLQFDEEIAFKPSGMQKSLTKKGKSSHVVFKTSHPNESVVFCQSKNQLIVEDMNFQSFSMESNEDRVLIHMIELNSNQIMKKWVIFQFIAQLLKINKTFEDYRSVNQVKVSKNKVLNYDYLLKNRTNNERSYKFYSSNHAVISVPEFPVILSQNQETKVQLSITVKKEDLTVQEKQKGIEVIVRIEESSKEFGWNQLFRVLIN